MPPFVPAAYLDPDPADTAPSGLPRPATMAADQTGRQLSEPRERPGGGAIGAKP